MSKGEKFEDQKELFFNIQELLFDSMAILNTICRYIVLDIADGNDFPSNIDSKISKEIKEVYKYQEEFKKQPDMFFIDEIKNINLVITDIKKNLAKILDAVNKLSKYINLDAINDDNLKNGIKYINSEYIKYNSNKE